MKKEQIEAVLDFTPTWETALPFFLSILEGGTYEGRTAAKGELLRMAKLADLQVEAMKQAALDTSAAGLVPPPIGTGL